MTPASPRPVRPDDLQEVSPGVFYGTNPFVVVDPGIVAFLKLRAAGTPMRRARLCAHPDPQTIQHDMLIVSMSDTYVSPHRHHSKTETLLVVEGEADVLVFEPDGTLSGRFRIGTPSSRLPFFYRMPAGQYHSLDIRSEALVFVESTLGPFRHEAMENAPWAPGPQDPEAGRNYIARLRGNILPR